MRLQRIPLRALAVCLVVTILTAGCTGNRVKIRGLDPEDEVDAALVAIGGRSQFKAVDLTYMNKDDACAAEWADDACVMTRPKDATIWKDKTKYNGKPKKIRWWIDEDQEDKFHLEIVYKGADPNDNWLGTIPPIECGKKKTKSGKIAATVEPGDDLDWPYRITVFECTGGEKGDCLCKTDPEIRIHD